MGYGDSCTRCGCCCSSEVCAPGKAVYKTAAAPCPGLKFDGEKHSCELVEIVSEEHKAFFLFRMGIGVGCDSEFGEVVD